MTWICRYCQQENDVQDETCAACGVEDCNQGEGRPIPPIDPHRAQRLKLKASGVLRA